MMDPRKRPIYLPEISNVVSSSECTGLVPARPADREGLEAELDLSSTALPRTPEEDLPV